MLYLPNAALLALLASGKGCKAVRVQVELSGKGLHINSPDDCIGTMHGYSLFR